MAYFPLFIELEAAPCLVVGGGPRGPCARCRSCCPTAQKLKAVAPDFLPAFRRLEKEAGLELHCREFRPDDLAGSTLVIAAAGDRAVNRRIAALCRAAGIPVNAVDDKEACTFLFPALVRRGRSPSASLPAGPAPAPPSLSRSGWRPACPSPGYGRGGRLREILAYLASLRPRSRGNRGRKPAGGLFSALFDACLERGRP